MKKTLILVMAIICICASVANAEDVVINAIVASATIAIDKNGNEYVRIIIVEPRQLQGVEYDVGVPIMFFGDFVEKAKTLKKGDRIHVVVNKRLYQGNFSYTALAVIENVASKE